MDIEPNPFDKKVRGILEVSRLVNLTGVSRGLLLPRTRVFPRLTPEALNKKEGRMHD